MRAAIIGGELEAGVVYSAPALGARLGVSPTPVREAMMQLAKEGLIEIVRNKGYQILEPSESDLDNIVELRSLLEIPMVGKVAKVGVTRKQRAELQRLADATVKAAANGDITGHVSADIAFHTRLLQLTGNDQLVEVVRVLRGKLRLFGLSAPENVEHLWRSSEEHVQLVTLIAEGDRRGAEELMKRHLRHIRREWGRKPIKPERDRQERDVE